MSTKKIDASKLVDGARGFLENLPQDRMLATDIERLRRELGKIIACAPGEKDNAVLEKFSDTLANMRDEISQAQRRSLGAHIRSNERSMEAQNTFNVGDSAWDKFGWPCTVLQLEGKKRGSLKVQWHDGHTERGLGPSSFRKFEKNNGQEMQDWSRLADVRVQFGDLVRSWLNDSQSAKLWLASVLEKDNSVDERFKEHVGKLAGMGIINEAEASVYLLEKMAMLASEEKFKNELLAKCSCQARQGDMMVELLKALDAAATKKCRELARLAYEAAFPEVKSRQRK